MDAKIRHDLAAGRDLYTGGDYQGARSLLESVAAAHPKLADVQNMLGVIAHQEGRTQDAQLHLESALRANPYYNEAALNLAVVYNEVGRYGDAREVYGRAVRGVGSHDKTAVENLDRIASIRIANLHAELGDCYLAVGELDRAAEHLKAAVAAKPRFPDLRLKLATTLRDLGRSSEALDMLLGIVQQDSDYLPARLQLGVTYWALSQFADARREWEAVLDRDPNNRNAKFYLATLDD
jgi:tetratricopeptide (TPR) repeat protein